MYIYIYNIMIYIYIYILKQVSIEWHKSPVFFTLSLTISVAVKLLDILLSHISCFRLQISSTKILVGLAYYTWPILKVNSQGRVFLMRVKQRKKWMLDFSFPGLYVLLINHSYIGLFELWTIRTIDYSYPGSFVPRLTCAYLRRYGLISVYGIRRCVYYRKTVRTARSRLTPMYS